jgi:hypothetical protein
LRQSIDINNHLLCFDHTAGHSECIPVWQRYKKNSALEEQINKAIIKRYPNAKSNIVQGKTDSQWNVLYQNNKKKNDMSNKGRKPWSRTEDLRIWKLEDKD